MFGISLKPEMIFGIIKAIPSEKVQETRREIIGGIVEAELQAGSPLMLVLTADHKQFALNLDIYRKSGEHIARQVVHDIASIFTAIEAIKNFDFSKINQKQLNGEPEPTAADTEQPDDHAAAGDDHTATAATDTTGTGL